MMDYVLAFIGTILFFSVAAGIMYLISIFPWCGYLLGGGMIFTAVFIVVLALVIG